MIHVDGLYHSYTHSERYAVEGLSFDVAPGEIFGFLGPNGAGKSTTLKILTGVIPVQAGTVSIAEMDVRRRPSRMRNLIGVSFEQPNLYLKLTGSRTSPSLRGCSTRRQNRPWSFCGSWGSRRRPTSESAPTRRGCSSGSSWRAALLDRPSIWSQDEPVLGLDPASSRDVVSLIRKLRVRGTTVFITTHDVHIVHDLCDRVAFLNE